MKKRIYKINKIYLFFILIVLITTSCRTVSFVNLQVLKPAEITLPKNVKSFSVVNNSFLQNQYSIVTKKRKSNIDYKMLNIDTTKVKNLSVNSIVKSLTEMLNDSPLFTKAVLVNEKQKKETLNWDYVSSICKKNETEALISLEAFIHDDSVSFDGFYTDYGYVYYTFMNFKVTTVWRIYYPDEKKIIDRDIQISNVPFEAYAYSFKESIKELPNEQVISEEIANYTANDFFRRISPAWTDCSRMYFTGSTNMLKAKNFVENNYWKEATELWQNDVNNKNKRISGDAAYNMALAFEMEGDLDNALVWAKKSYQIYGNKWALDYIKKLEVRIKEQVKLNKQFAGEDIVR
ncbi:MAG: hypothetical protein DRJ01_07005 [Bacteroidetes bacterium]|nr:MAG: hypothetical protein DRJ01_07005 [Bacteroidota bacterium]